MTSPEELASTVRIVTVAEVYGSPEAIQDFRERMETTALDLGAGAVHTTVAPEHDIKEEVRDRLEDSFSPLLSSVAPIYRVPVDIALRGQGIYSVRDILVLGEERLRQHEGVGDDTIKSIRARLPGLSLPFQFKTVPSIEDIAAMCDDLSQVVVHVITTPYLLRRVDLAFGGPRRVTVQDALRQTRLFKALVTDHLAVHEEAVLFAEQFQRAKAAMRNS